MDNDVAINLNINNSPAILNALIAVFNKTENMALGWIIENNAFPNNFLWKSYRNNTAKYFRIYMEILKFGWVCNDNDPRAEDYQLIDSVEEANSIAEFAVANTNTFKCNYQTSSIPVKSAPKQETFYTKDTEKYKLESIPKYNKKKENSDIYSFYHGKLEECYKQIVEPFNPKIPYFLGWQESGSF